MPAAPNNPRAFISYRRESDAHVERVFAFSDRLRRDGNIVTVMDEHIKDTDTGWRRWMKEQLKEADKIIMIFTPAYRRCFEGEEEPGSGAGATYEGCLISEQLYRNNGKNAKCRVVLLEGESADCIPAELRDYTSYPMDNPLGFQGLVEWLWNVEGRPGAEVRPGPPDFVRNKTDAKPDSEPSAETGSPASRSQREGAQIPALYTTRIDTLRTLCGVIRFFGRVRPDMPMERNFVNLQIQPRLGEKQIDENRRRREKQMHWRREDQSAWMEGAAEKEDFMLRAFRADDLWQRHPGGLILGLPGAGKTTLLRHCTHLALPNPRWLILFIECKALQAAHFQPPHGHARRPTPGLPDHLRSVAAAFLFPDLPTGTQQLTPEQDTILGALLPFVLQAWDQKRLVVMIDAFDETPPPVARETKTLIEGLLNTVPPQDEGDGPDEPRVCHGAVE